MSNSSMLSLRKRPIVVSGQPSFEWPDSQLVSAAQIYEPSFQRWTNLLGCQTVMDRKIWEYSYILQAVHAYGTVAPGSRGLAFGCGKEKAASIFAAQGCDIVATDFTPEIEFNSQWAAKTRDDLYFEDCIDRETFEERVKFRHVDMNNIDDDLRDFDFCWSTGSLEHIGSHANGLKFVESAMDCLKPGGLAVHTTEFVISSETSYRDYHDLSFYCRADIEALAMRLLDSGHMIVLNFERGSTIADNHVDAPPFHHGMSLAAHFHTHIITSIGMIIQKGHGHS